MEYDAQIAGVYAERFPYDHVIVGDAHAFLLAHYEEYDFIWSSPPCQSHGQYRYNVGVRAKGYAPLYPDLRLYEEILFFRHHVEALWVVENVKPYYEPLVAPSVILQRHYLWSNFDIPEREFPAKMIRSRNKIEDYADLGVDLSSLRGKDKRQILRNAVDGNLGLHVLDSALMGKFSEF